MIEYQFKTDRRTQAQKYEQNHIANGQAEAWDIDQYLFDEAVPEESQDWSRLDIPSGLAYYRDRSLDGWARYLNSYTGERWNEHQRKYCVEQVVLTGLGDHYQHVEDDLYYFRTFLDETWSAQTRIKLECVSCGDFEPINANYAFQCMGVSLSRWLKNKEDAGDHYNGHTRFLLPFFESLLPHVDTRVYSEKYIKAREMAKGCEKASVGRMQNGLLQIIVYAHKPETGEDFIDKRIAVAKEFYALFESRKKQIPNWKKCVDFNLEHARKRGYL